VQGDKEIAFLARKNAQSAQFTEHTSDSNADNAVVDAVSELNKVLPSPNELTLGENQSNIWLPSLVANG